MRLIEVDGEEDEKASSKRGARKLLYQNNKILWYPTSRDTDKEGERKGRRTRRAHEREEDENKKHSIIFWETHTHTHWLGGLVHRRAQHQASQSIVGPPPGGRRVRDGHGGGRQGPVASARRAFWPVVLWCQCLSSPPRPQDQKHESTCVARQAPRNGARRQRRRECVLVRGVRPARRRDKRRGTTQGEDRGRAKKWKWYRGGGCVGRERRTATRQVPEEFPRA